MTSALDTWRRQLTTWEADLESRLVHRHEMCDVTTQVVMHYRGMASAASDGLRGSSAKQSAIRVATEYASAAMPDQAEHLKDLVSPTSVLGALFDVCMQRAETDQTHVLSFALSILNKSPTAYRHLRGALPGLPSPSTLSLFTYVAALTPWALTLVIALIKSSTLFADRSTSQHTDSQGVDKHTLQIVKDHVRGLPLDHPRRHCSLQFDELSIQSGLQYRASTGELIGFVTQSPFTAQAMGSGGADISPDAPTGSEKTERALIAAQHDQLSDGLSTLARVFLIHSFDRLLTMAVSTQFVRDDGVGKQFDTAMCIMSILTDLATIDVHIHGITADNHASNTVSSSIVDVDISGDAYSRSMEYACACSPHNRPPGNCLPSWQTSEQAAWLRHLDAASPPPQPRPSRQPTTPTRTTTRQLYLRPSVLAKSAQKSSNPYRCHLLSKRMIHFDPQSRQRGSTATMTWSLVTTASTTQSFLARGCSGMSTSHTC